MSDVKLKCTECATEYSLEERGVVCRACRGVLDVEYDYKELQNRVDKTSLLGSHSMWRYAALFPITQNENIVSLGEGLTPLQKAEKYGKSLGLRHLHIKLDYMNPTGSFKDRGNSASVSKLKELGIHSAMDDTSGNAGASLAAYCARAGIQCTLYVPFSAPNEKLVQAGIYGARIERIHGTRGDVAKAAETASKTERFYYASHNLSPFFLEGLKTVAFELVEDMCWQVPDHVIFPVGGGTLLVGAYRGFDELIRFGWIDRMPKLHCVQSEACMPIVQAFRKGSESIEAVSDRNTVAGGIRIPNPARGKQVLEALHNTDGHAVEVSDEAIQRHQLILARMEGIFAEPTSCAALAGLERLHQMNIVGEDDSVVIELTGFGLKDTTAAANSVASAERAGTLHTSHSARPLRTSSIVSNVDFTS